MREKTPLKLVRSDRAAGDAVAAADGPETASWLGRERAQSALSLARALLGDASLPGGEPALSHGVGTAAVVSEMNLDDDAIAAAVLAPVAQIAPERVTAVREPCGAAVADLVDGIARMVHLRTLSGRETSAARTHAGEAQREALRKMLLAMVQDMRVVLVSLADHLQELRYAVRSEEAGHRRFVATLAQDIYAPLANRLGVWQLKWEMEDLAFRILDPDTYKRIARLLDEKRLDRERYIEAVIAQLKGEFVRNGMSAEVSGRPKHIFSIYRKMMSKGIDFKSLYDVRAIRIMVAEERDCYTALGLVHNLWTPISGEFDDYIARPKSNQYRSLHTAVVGPDDKALEIQIRTPAMHRHAELGVAAHWRYKEGSSRDPGYDRKIAWLRSILEWKDEGADSGALAERFRAGLIEDTIYVLTPQDRVIALPKDATPVDFAYHVHTELGHRCRGARVDGVMVPLNTPLRNGQRVEIVSAKQGGPSRDWLLADAGFVRSAGARAKIRQWFNRQNLDAAVAQGRAVVEKALQRLGMTSLRLDDLAARLGFEQIDELLAAAGRGEIGPQQVERAARPAQAPVDTTADAAPKPVPAAKRAVSQGGSVLIVGVDRLLTVPARCCKPAPPEAIMGFVTRGRGVSIHRADCANLQRLAAERRVAAEWGASPGAVFAVDIEVDAVSRQGLQRDLSEALARERIHVVGSRSTVRDATMRLRFTIEVADLAQLGGVLSHIQDVRGVRRAARCRQASTGRGTVS